MQSLVHDLRYALRQLRRAPGFAVTAVLTLGLGLGAATTVWSVVHDVLLTPAPFAHPAELAGLAFDTPDGAPSLGEIGESADYLQQHAHSYASTGIAEDSTNDANLSMAGGSARPMQVHMRWVSAGYLPTLGTVPELGRTFTLDEDWAGSAKVVLLSDSLWRSEFAADRTIVGKTVHVDEEPFTVVGVMPAGFRDPSIPEQAEVWEPLALGPSQPGYDGDNYVMVGRLRPGVSLQAAQAEANALTSSFLREHPHYLRWTPPGSPHLAYGVWPLAQALTSNVRASLLTMLAAVGLVLLLVCLNLAGLFGTRIAQRRAELELRAALGAGRAQLLRLLLCEAALLAVSAALGAAAFGAIARPALLAGSPVPLPVLGAAGTLAQLLFLLLASFAASIVFAGLPAAAALRRRPQLPGRGSVGISRTQNRIGAWLVAAQACFATVLLVGAALLLGAFLRLQAASPGFSPQHLLAAQLALHGDRYNTAAAKDRFIQQVSAQLAQAPGVLQVGAIDGLPLRKGLNIGMSPDRPTNLPNLSTELRPVSPGYFSTMGLHLIAGRTLLPTDVAHGLPVAVISQTTARLWWPGDNPIGHRVRFGGKETFPMQVVGVVADTHANSLAEPFRATVYAPYAQLPDAVTRIVNRWIATSFVLRVADGVPVGKVIDQAVRSADPEMPVAGVATLQSLVRKSNAAPRFFSSLASAFSMFALLLTALGLFGLLSYQVVQRTRELGLRMAVGATREHILFSVLRRGVLLTLAGAALGSAAGFTLPPLLANILNETILSNGPSNASSLMAHPLAAALLSAATLLSAALLACSLPAWRAAHIDPLEALRSE